MGATGGADRGLVACSTQDRNNQQRSEWNNTSLVRTEIWRWKQKKDWPASQASREVRKKNKKNLQQKTLAAWCTQHRNQAHKSRIWLQDEKHQNHREDQRGDHELACSRNKNQRPVGGDRKNQTRRTDLCGRKMEQKTRVQEEKGNQAQYIWNLKKQFFHFNKNYNRSIQSRRSPSSLPYLIIRMKMSFWHTSTLGTMK
jgi:hypothetical protein